MNTPSTIPNDATTYRFLDYYRDAANWAGTPLVGGNVGRNDDSDKGYVLNMKKRGWITTWEDDGDVFMDFTEEGEAVAWELLAVAKTTTEEETPEQPTVLIPALVAMSLSDLDEDRREFLFDVFVTAMEGGSNYWCYRHDYRCMQRGEDGQVIKKADGYPEYDTEGFYAVITVDNEPDLGRITVNAATIALGLSRILSAKTFEVLDWETAKVTHGDIKNLGKGTANAIRRAWTECEAGDIDAELADVVLQVGIFDEVVYG